MISQSSAADLGVAVLSVAASALTATDSFAVRAGITCTNETQGQALFEVSLVLGNGTETLTLAAASQQVDSGGFLKLDLDAIFQLLDGGRLAASLSANGNNSGNGVAASDVGDAAWTNAAHQPTTATLLITTDTTDPAVTMNVNVFAGESR